MRPFDRRALLRGGLASIALMAAGPALAHTPYRQWVVYRQKHLMLGTHRGDPEGYRIAKRVADVLLEHLPASRARVARAPAATRLAGLLATGQLDVAVLQPASVAAMMTADGVFSAYGRVRLRTLAMLVDDRTLVAVADFPGPHAAAVTEALIGSPVAPAAAQKVEPPAPWHPGAREILRETGIE